MLRSLKKKIKLCKEDLLELDNKDFYKDSFEKNFYNEKDWIWFKEEENTL